MSNTNLTNRRALPLFRYPVFFGPGGSINCVTAFPPSPAVADTIDCATSQTRVVEVLPSPPAISNWSVLLACTLWLLAAGAVMWFLHGGSEMRPVAAQLCWLIIPVTLGYTVTGGAAKATKRVAS